MSNLLAKQDLTAEQMQMVASEMRQKEKSKGILYALWLFTGGLGGHRYYLGDIPYAIGMTFTLGGLGIWALIDVFFIGNRLEKINENKEAEIIDQVKVYQRGKENSALAN